MFIVVSCLILFLTGGSLILVKNKFSYMGAMLLVSSMGIPDMYYIPRIDDDLHRYFSEMQFVSQFPNIHSLLYSYKYMTEFSYHRTSVIYDIFQWLISRTGYFNLLPFFSVVITYFCLLLPIIHEKNKGKISSFFSFMISLLLIGLFPYHSVSSTVRENIAASIFFLITYLYLINKHNKYRLLYLMLYIPLIFIHEAMVLPLILVLLAILLPKDFKWRYYFLIIIVFIFIIYIVRFIGANGTSNSILGIANKYSDMSVTPYIQSDTSRIMFISFMVIPYLCSIGDLLCLGSLNKKDKSIELNLYIVFNLSSILLLFWSLIIAQRYIPFVALIDVLLLVQIKEKYNINNNMFRIIYFMSIILSISVFILLGFKGMTFDFSNIVQY